MAANPKELIRESTVHSYKALMDVSWNFDYEAGVPKIEDLYKRAKDNQWNADHLKWDTPIDPSNRSSRRSFDVLQDAVLQEAVDRAAGDFRRALDGAAAVAVPAR
jgi:hypothetical protein